MAKFEVGESLVYNRGACTFVRYRKDPDGIEDHERCVVRHDDDGLNYAALAVALRPGQRAHAEASGWLRPKPEAKGNATCHHCGGPAYLGLSEQTCLREGGCGVPALAMPERLERGYHHGGHGEYAADGAEYLWEARGRGARVHHPTREGAIAAWREAVANLSYLRSVDGRAWFATADGLRVRSEK